MKEAEENAGETTPAATDEGEQEANTPATALSLSDRERIPEDAEVQESAEMVLHAEQLEVERREVSAGGVLLRKKIVTDEVDESVEVRREEIEIVRLSPEEAAQRQSNEDEAASNELSEGEIFIPLRRETAVGEKVIVTDEVVQVTKTSVTEDEQIEATLRRETLETERVRGEEGEAPVAEENTGADTAAATEETSSAPDAAFRERVVQQLREDLSLDDSAIAALEFEIEGNAVRLSGQAPEDVDGERIEASLRSLEGVEVVHNDL
ncbi:MAG: DUF2382 domain-containing protein [Opitutales bacterium]